MRIKVTAPGSTSNLGPGFDCLGAALSLNMTLEVRTGGSGVWTYIQIGVLDERPPPDLILRAIEAVAGDVGPVDLSVSSSIPLARGLGSSGAAIAAGLLAGCAIAGRTPDPEELLELGLPLEGHPDNLAPSLHGGLVLVVQPLTVMTFRPSAALRPSLLVPSHTVETAEARRMLPESVPLRDAIANVSRASGLLALLTGMVEPTAERLLRCTEDLLHQPYRAKLMTETATALEKLRADGVPAVVSGAGPSVLCLLAEDAAAPRLDGWDTIDASWDVRGARMTVTDDG